MLRRCKHRNEVPIYLCRTVLGNAELARQEVAPGHPAQARLKEIRKAGRRAKELVRQILAFGLPIAVASGYLTEEMRAAARAAGVSELIFKPDTVDSLCVVIARLANALPDLDFARPQVFSAASPRSSRTGS